MKAQRIYETTAIANTPSEQLCKFYFSADNLALARDHLNTLSNDPSFFEAYGYKQSCGLSDAKFVGWLHDGGDERKFLTNPSESG